MQEPGGRELISGKRFPFFVKASKNPNKKLFALTLLSDAFSSQTQALQCYDLQS